jgi:transposase
MIRVRQDIEAQARGVLKTYGRRLGAVSQRRDRVGFRDQLRAAASGDPILEMVAASLIAVHDVVCAEAGTIEDELLAIARDSGLTRRLMTVPGVGPIVALNFIAAVDDVGRFARATDVGAYLGLTPRRYQSGEIDYSGRITKRGNGAMRALLFEAATVLITRVRRFSPLKAWAVRLAARKGFKKAAVAAARKIAVVMLRLWRDGTSFAWSKEEMPA